MKLNNFNIQEYINMLKVFRGIGYQFSKFPQHNSNIHQSKDIVLRHDVDFCVDYALKMAEYESENAVMSTYFFLVNSEFYNPFSTSNKNKIVRIHNMGHDIGLHYDFQSNLDVYNTLELMKIVIPQIRSDIVSIHQPKDTNIIFDNDIQHSYEARYSKKIGYCSDSRGIWAHGNPFEQNYISKLKSFQLLIHPIWWIMEGETPIDKITNFINNRTDLITSSIEENFTIHSY